MTCQECELKLGISEDVGDIGEHLASCLECRGIARELRLNLDAMRGMKRRPAVRWVWAFAVAAVVVAGIFLWTAPREEKMTIAVSAPKVMRTEVRLHAKARATRTVKPKSEPLRVKMFTSDPDVVIYWIVDKKDGFE